VIQPNHIETVIARLNGKIWKYSRYFDNPQFWSTPGDPTPQDVVVSPPDEPPPSTEGVYTIEYTVSVKTQPLPDEFEMYNVTDDPGELDNLYGQGYPEQAVLESLLAEQCAKKRLTPASGIVPGSRAVERPASPSSIVIGETR
jgi:choline-sulfatase